ncbi:hypothetical protein EM595_p1084 (plasmid) [Duffyella gerundensis]|uniref:Uncharacterized protein n=1 Tax=Duffyella gerundensis TaxID=1619313 RepID=A0A0U5L695_9GAMM|nr:hypothetical protein [Duffyella gerundensis]CUU26330.1 hypothetical protein EM595_p1084 [Duffyella gerundensis]
MFRNLVNLIRVLWRGFLAHKAKATGMLVLIAVLCGYLNDIGATISNMRQWLSSKKENLVVIKARLKPYRIRPDIHEGRDEAFLVMEVRNYSNITAMITAASVTVTGSHVARNGRAGWYGRCSLTSDKNANTPLSIAPGETKWVMISSAIVMPGLADLLDQPPFSKVFVATPEAPYTVAEHYLIASLNSKFSALYGPNAAIKATLYDGPNDEPHYFSFPLAHGKSIFEKDGSLQHDWLMANWKYPSAALWSSLSKDCQEPADFE